jgi:hypothetical protein
MYNSKTWGIGLVITGWCWYTSSLPCSFWGWPDGAETCKGLEKLKINLLIGHTGRSLQFTFISSATEFVDFKIIVICLYRSPHGDVKIFLWILVEIISMVIKKGLFWWYVAIWILTYCRKIFIKKLH